LGPTPNPQSPIPNPQSPKNNLSDIFYIFFFKYYYIIQKNKWEK